MTRPTGLLLRVFVEAADIRAAMAGARELIDQLGADTAVVSLQIEPYWKMEGWQEITLEMKADDRALAFRRVADRLSPHWVFGGDQNDPDAVWSRREHGESLMGAAAKWAQLQLRFPPAQ